MTPLYWYVPVAAFVLVLGSVVWRRCLPHRRDPFTMALVVGLPLAAVAFFWAADVVHPQRPSLTDEMPHNEQSELSLGLFVVGFELVLAWPVALLFVLLRWVPGALMMGDGRGADL
jgi:predicted membrane protein